MKRALVLFWALLAGITAAYVALVSAVVLQGLRRLPVVHTSLLSVAGWPMLAAFAVGFLVALPVAARHA